MNLHEWLTHTPVLFFLKRLLPCISLKFNFGLNVDIGDKR